MNLVVATAFLKETQVMIDTASGGKESVELAGKNKYDVILMDQRMPEMDGEEALHAIRAQKDGPNIETPVICLTADAVVGARERYLSKGFTDYLTKPIDSTSLEKMLRKYIPTEKIELVSNQSPQAPAQSEDSPLKALQDSGIDTVKGIANCGADEAFYRTILAEYRKGAEEKKKNLQIFLENNDMHNYEILIHSLKSTSATIGAMTPSRLAAELEAAAKKEDISFVRSHHEAFVKEYDRTLLAIDQVLPETASDDDEILEFLPEED